jgi:hypothetical protein
MGLDIGFVKLVLKSRFTSQYQSPNDRNILFINNDKNI